MHRRTLLRAALVAGIGVVTGTLASGCTPEAPRASPRPPDADATPRPLGTETVTPSTRPRVLLAYFSRAGENYHYGDTVDLEVGNTQVVADMIAGLIPVEVYRIEASDPYPHEYGATVDRNVREQNADARPAIAAPLPDVSVYDVVLLGSGIWNVRPPMIMSTFAEGVDLAGKTVHPFVTFAVSRLGRTVEVYERLLPDARIGDALAVQGEEARSAGTQVETWLNTIGLRGT